MIVQDVGLRTLSIITDHKDAQFYCNIEHYISTFSAYILEKNVDASVFY